MRVKLSYLPALHNTTIPQMPEDKKKMKSMSCLFSESLIFTFLPIIFEAQHKVEQEFLLSLARVSKEFHHQLYCMQVPHLSLHYTVPIHDIFYVGPTRVSGYLYRKERERRDRERYRQIDKEIGT